MHGRPSGQLRLRHPAGLVPGGKEPSLTGHTPTQGLHFLMRKSENNHTFPRRW